MHFRNLQPSASVMYISLRTCSLLQDKLPQCLAQESMPCPSCRSSNEASLLIVNIPSLDLLIMDVAKMQFPGAFWPLRHSAATSQMFHCNPFWFTCASHGLTFCHFTESKSLCRAAKYTMLDVPVYCEISNKLVKKWYHPPVPPPPPPPPAASPSDAIKSAHGLRLP